MFLLQGGMFGLDTQQKRIDQVMLAAAGGAQELCEICMCSQQAAGCCLI